MMTWMEPRALRRQCGLTRTDEALTVAAGRSLWLDLRGLQAHNRTTVLRLVCVLYVYQICVVAAAVPQSEVNVFGAPEALRRVAHRVLGAPSVDRAKHSVICAHSRSGHRFLVFLVVTVPFLHIHLCIKIVFYHG